MALGPLNDYRFFVEIPKASAMSDDDSEVEITKETCLVLLFYEGFRI